MSWVRSGECCQCGACCKGTDPFLGELGPPPVPGYCALYRLFGDHGHCAGHEAPEHPYYLKGCNVWPSIPDHIKEYPLCSYTFCMA